jgi:hypothetical protein
VVGRDEHPKQAAEAHDEHNSCDEDLDDREATLLADARSDPRGRPTARQGRPRCARTDTCPSGSREDGHEGIIGSNGGNQ